MKISFHQQIQISEHMELQQSASWFHVNMQVWILFPSTNFRSWRFSRCRIWLRKLSIHVCYCFGKVCLCLRPLDLQHNACQYSDVLLPSHCALVGANRAEEISVQSHFHFVFWHSNGALGLSPPGFGEEKEQLLTLNVGVRRPFSKVKGSGTKVTAFANSKPLSYRVIRNTSKNKNFRN